jgi:hypothetical protein
MVFVTMRQNLEAMPWKQPPYRTRYPELAALEKYYQRGEGIPPENNVLIRNISVGGKWLAVGWGAQPKMLTLRDNLVDTDPHFVNPAAGDFRLRNDSPAFKLGFQPIPWERIGLKKVPDPR